MKYYLYWQNVAGFWECDAHNDLDEARKAAIELRAQGHLAYISGDLQVWVYAP